MVNIILLISKQNVLNQNEEAKEVIWHSKDVL